MRLLYLSLLIPLTLTFAISPLSNSTFSLEARKKNNNQSPAPQTNCHSNPTCGRRPDDNCNCYPGFIEVDDDTCKCGDSKNTEAYFDIQNGKIKDAYCVCQGANQRYDDQDHKCYCLPGLVSQRKNGPNSKLSCSCAGDHQVYKPNLGKCKCEPGFKAASNTGNNLVCEPQCGPHQVYKPNQDKCKCQDGYIPKPNTGNTLVCRPECGAFQVYQPNKDKCQCQDGYVPKPGCGDKLVCIPSCGANQHYDDNTHCCKCNSPYIPKTPPGPVLEAVEVIMRCAGNEKACKVEGEWKCYDVVSSLQTCGGCPGEAIDCSSLPGVNEVSCIRGKCSINSCQRSFTLVKSRARAEETSEAYCTSNTPSQMLYEAHQAIYGR